MQHNFDDGKNVSTLTSVLPYHLRVYLDQQMYLVRQDFQRNHFGTIPRSSLI